MAVDGKRERKVSATSVCKAYTDKIAVFWDAWSESVRGG